MRKQIQFNAYLMHCHGASPHAQTQKPLQTRHCNNQIMPQKKGKKHVNRCTSRALRPDIPVSNDGPSVPILYPHTRSHVVSCGWAKSLAGPTVTALGKQLTAEMWQLTRARGVKSRNSQRPYVWEIYDAGPRRGSCQLLHEHPLWDPRRSFRCESSQCRRGDHVQALFIQAIKRVKKDVAESSARV
jgi:hypothetical protein